MDHGTFRTLLTPEALDLDELAPLDDVVRGARSSPTAQVVGVGEGAHFVAEFSRARESLVRYLVERHGFNAIGLECGALQGARLDAWLASPPGTRALEEVAGPLTCALYGSLLLRLQAWRAETGRALRLVGVDLPNTLDPREDLADLAEALGRVDPSMVPEVEALSALLASVDGQSALTSSQKWGEVDPGRRDEALSRALRLRHRLLALAPVLGEGAEGEAFRRASERVASVEYTLETLRVMDRLFSGASLEGDTSVRDAYMARAVTSLVDAAPEVKLILLAHDNHLQKTPVSFAGELTAVPMGLHLARRADYRAIALTHLGDTVPEMDFPAPASPVGFAAVTVPADAPGDGHVERQLLDACGPGRVSWLRTGADTPATRLRSQSASVVTQVRDAFDFVVCTPGAGKDPRVTF